MGERRKTVIIGHIKQPEPPKPDKPSEAKPAVVDYPKPACERSGPPRRKTVVIRPQSYPPVDSAPTVKSVPTPVPDASRDIPGEIGYRRKPNSIHTYYYDSLSSNDKVVFTLIKEAMFRFEDTVVAGTSDDLMGTITALNLSFPELYYVDWMRGIACERSLFRTVFRINYCYGRAECIGINNAMLKEISTYKRQATDYATVRYLHRRFIEELSYDFDGIKTPPAHCITGALIYKKAVCEGIAEAACIILNRLGVVTTLRMGKNKRGSDGHAWNVVTIAGKNYNMDITNDLNYKNHKVDFPILKTDSQMGMLFEVKPGLNCNSTYEG